jgi:hypothetical protein
MASLAAVVDRNLDAVEGYHFYLEKAREDNAFRTREAHPASLMEVSGISACIPGIPGVAQGRLQ